MDELTKENRETERFLTPGFVFLFPTVSWCLVSILVLTTLPGLIGAYNYLRGMPSIIDQTIVTLLGSDIPRVIIVASFFVGILVGAYFSRFVTTKLDMVRTSDEVQISTRFLAVLQTWWVIPVGLFTSLSLLETAVYGYLTSDFISQVGWFTMAGCFLAFSIPILIKYIRLVQYSRSIDSELTLTGIPIGTGIRKHFENLTLQVTGNQTET